MKNMVTKFQKGETIFWKKNNKLHREDGPALLTKKGVRYWFNNGKLHREDGPAIEFANGTKEWWFNGELIYTERATK